MYSLRRISQYRGFSLSNFADCYNVLRKSLDRGRCPDAREVGET